ncbi:hypothetical protein KCP69_20895 [Salmonella enterica subsp. enterica]|nr:hypothetical protein KCP69_20895 [Salmonella enterica subsp. enterica]
MTVVLVACGLYNGVYRRRRESKKLRRAAHLIHKVALDHADRRIGDGELAFQKWWKVKLVQQFAGYALWARQPFSLSATRR